MTPVGQYSDYKSSGIDWLGDIPTHWDTIKLKNGFDLHKRPAVKTAGIVTAFRDGQVTLRSNRRIDGYTEGDKQIGYQTIHPGDLVIHAMDAFAGAIGVSDSFGQSTPVYSVCTPKSGFNSYFYARALRHIALTGYIASLAKGVRERSTDFRWADAKELPVPRPPIEEQDSIVAFLDRETAQIDELIGKQERLIELLAEKRQAIITHAVTKGLDPTAPTKPSGIPWVGDVPASWTVQRTSWVFQTISSGTTPPSENLNYYDGDTNWVTTGELRESEISTTAKRVTQKALTDLPSLRVYSPGALLIAMYGATIGRLGILSAPAATNQACCVFDRPTRVTTRFAFFALMAAKEHLLVLASGGGQPNINQEKLRALRIPVPPIAEQKTIVEEIDRKVRGIDSLSGRSQNVIALLRERRSALISAAVTGKIDVQEGAASV